MAEKVERLQLDAKVDSAGFEKFHRGDPADSRSVAVAAKHGIDLSSHIARMFTVRDFDHFDLIYVMDRNNYKDVLGVARDREDGNKVDYILNLVNPGENRPVPDPWYGGKEGFEKIYHLIDEACDILVRKISHDHQINPSRKS